MPLTNDQYCFMPASQRARGFATSALLLLAVVAGCAQADGGGGTDYSASPDGGSYILTPDAGNAVGVGGGTLGGSIVPMVPVPPTSGTAAGGSVSGTGSAGGSLSGTAGGSVSGAGGSLSGSTGSTGTASGTASGTSLLGGLAGGTTGGIIGGLFGGAAGGTGAGSTTPVMPLDPSVKQPAASKLPQVKGTCPNLTNGATVSVNGSTAVLAVGTKAGPMVFYWHGTGSDSGESDTGLPGAADEIRRSGGVLASFEDSNGMGDDTGDAVWYTGDLESADQLLACAIQKNLVDTGRIYTAGYSAGGLQSGTMVLQRSNYLASAIVYSGGPPLGGLVPGSTNFVDKTNIPAVLGAHGAAGSDWLILDFHDGTILMEDTVKMAGGFAMDCDDNGSHLDFFTIRAGVGGQAWKFLKDHPYNAKPEPYTSVPAGFPSYCKIR